MVEENFEIWLSETLQNGLILLFSGVINFTWLKKILKFGFLKRSTGCLADPENPENPKNPEMEKADPENPKNPEKRPFF